MRILLTEDNLELAQLTARNLSQQGFAVDLTSSGKETLQLLKDGEIFDVLVLDLNLPDIDGLKLLTQIKKVVPQTPVLALTCRDKEEEKVTGLQIGFDDYMTKPFSSYELAARLRVLSRLPQKNNQQNLTIGPLKIAPPTHKVSFQGKKIDLSLNEFRLLCTLAQNAGQKVSCQKLLESVWDMNTPGDKAKLLTTISRLRSKLKDKKKAIIKTVPDGYLLNLR
jgi:DNA-binding response OmpR family regulator